MKQLTGLDTSFLTMETATQFGHVNSISILDPSGSRSGDLYADLRQAVAERLHLLEVYRRKLVRVPFGLDNPYWVDDGDLDLEYHIRELALPAPGDDAQLAEQVSRLAARPLDLTRPLWEWYVITGLQGGLVGLFTKLHHATIDGASGVELIHVLLDTEPEGPRHRAAVGAVGAGAHAHLAPAPRPDRARRSPPGRARSCGSRSGCSGPRPT